MSDSRRFEHRGTRAIERMVEHAPSSGGLALWIRHVDLPASDVQAPEVATDGMTIEYGPRFDALPLPRQAGLVAHQVLHVAFRHPHRLVALRQLIGDVDTKLFNVCADAIVNSSLGHLGWLELPPGAVTLEKLLTKVLDADEDPTVLLLAWDVERLYRAIDDRPPPTKGQERNDGPRAARVRALGDGTPIDLMAPTVEDDAPEAQAERDREWRERLLRAHAGDGAHSMLRVLGADLPKTRTPWEQVLRVQLARGLSTQPHLSWSRPSRSYLANQGRAGPGRRMPWEPGTSTTKRLPILAVCVDVSGSIDDRLLERFAREIEAITRRAEAGLVVVVGDDCVRSVERCAPGKSSLRELEFQGGGGTDFTPLLAEAASHRPDICVFLTDLDGPANLRPRFPVIWAVPQANAQAVAPFGRKLVLD